MERLDAFMARANAAYYATHDPFKDFTTAPEITQVFGELLGAWAAIVWDGMGRPAPVLLAECGPGRGTLMADARRATARVAPAFDAAARVHLIETSPRLRAAQAARVSGAVWHDTLSTLPPGPLILLANEFLDALPVRQFVGDGAAWGERYVEEGRGVLAPLPPEDARHLDLSSSPASITREHSPAAHAFIQQLAARLANEGGAALILDYGPTAPSGYPTLQALHEGRPADPLLDPGSRDLTAHVDFAGLTATARAAGAAVHGPVPQGPFLAALGLFQRTGVLARTQPPAKAGALIQSAQRLAEPNRMGGLFKAMALTHPALPTPPGFEAPPTQ